MSLFLLSVLCSLPCLALGDSALKKDKSQAAPTNKSSSFLYNGTTTLMQTSGHINFTIKTVGKDPKVLTSLLVPAANASSITSRVWNDTKRNVTVSSFQMAFKGPMASSGDGSFSSLSIGFEAALNSSTSYWKIANLTVNYTAKVGGKAYEGKSEAMDVDSDPGYTHANVDQSCERSHTSCAPKSLSWTCNGQQFLSLKSKKARNATSRAAAGGGEDGGSSGYAASILFPGFRYQPFFHPNSSRLKARFGSNWDCDALIPLPALTGLAITLGLLIIIYWSVDMITGLKTPDRFDDPHGKAIAVPTSD